MSTVKRLKEEKIMKTYTVLTAFGDKFRRHNLFAADNAAAMEKAERLIKNPTVFYVALFAGEKPVKNAFVARLMRNTVEGV